MSIMQHPGDCITLTSMSHCPFITQIINDNCKTQDTVATILHLTRSSKKRPTVQKCRLVTMLIPSALCNQAMIAKEENQKMETTLPTTPSLTGPGSLVGSSLPRSSSSWSAFASAAGARRSPRRWKVRTRKRKNRIGWRSLGGYRRALLMSRLEMVPRSMSLQYPRTLIKHPPLSITRVQNQVARLT